MQRSKPVLLSGGDTATLPIEIPRAPAATLILMVEASVLQTSHGARFYVQVFLKGPLGRDHDVGTFTLFGTESSAGRQVFAFRLEEEVHEALSSEKATLQASIKPFDEKADISEVRMELRAWAEAR